MAIVLLFLIPVLFDRDREGYTYLPTLAHRTKQQNAVWMEGWRDGGGGIMTYRSKTRRVGVSVSIFSGEPWGKGSIWGDVGLEYLLSRYTDGHGDVSRLRRAEVSPVCVFCALHVVISYSSSDLNPATVNFHG